MYSSLNLLALAVAGTATAKTIVINAGQSGFTFSPDSVTAEVGDMLEFHFFGSIHTAVQSDFSSPCQMKSGGFDSGKISNQADGSGDVFQVMVTNTDPIWFFCSTPTHCQGGMAGVVNPPSSGDSLASYKDSAAGTSSSSSGGTVQGGVVVPEGSSGSSSSSATSARASSTSQASQSSSPASTTQASKSSSESPSTTTSASKSVIPVTNSTAISVSTSAAVVPTSKASVPATSSAATTPTFAPVSRGASLVESVRKAVELTVLLGLAVIVAAY